MISNTTVFKNNHKAFESQLSEVFTRLEHVQNQLGLAHKMPLRYSYEQGVGIPLYESKLLTSYQN